MTTRAVKELEAKNAGLERAKRNEHFVSWLQRNGVGGRTNCWTPLRIGNVRCANRETGGSVAVAIPRFRCAGSLNVIIGDDT